MTANDLALKHILELVAERDSARAEAQALRHERDSLAARLTAVQAERDALREDDVVTNGECEGMVPA